MEGRFVVTALFITVLAACSKQDTLVNPTQETFVTQQTGTQSKLFISGWESIPLWKTVTKNKATIFSYARKIPNLNDDNVTVLVFVRNLWAGDETDKEPAGKMGKPLMMPFYFLPYFEEPNYTEEWTYTISQNKIDVSLILKETRPVMQPGKKVQLQFFVIPRQILTEKKLTTESVRKLSYDSLIQTFGSSAS